ncbi:hypothetical protein PGQ11_008838 [Apiospora arundinis]|uniref:Uncharacterized protein n=1 Tax=Apiospora arundinis TaxID=335852 RepID=A0ABR2IH41_9PEZI
MQHIYPGESGTTQTLEWTVLAVIGMRLLLMAGRESLATFGTSEGSIRLNLRMPKNMFTDMGIRNIFVNEERGTAWHSTNIGGMFVEFCMPLETMFRAA